MRHPRRNGGVLVRLNPHGIGWRILGPVGVRIHGHGVSLGERGLAMPKGQTHRGDTETYRRSHQNPACDRYWNIQPEALKQKRAIHAHGDFANYDTEPFH